MQVLVVLNVDDEADRRSATAVGLARALVRNEDTSVRLFIVVEESGAVGTGPPADDREGLTRLVKDLVAAGVEVRVVGALPNAPGTPGALRDVLGVEPSTVRGLAEWTLDADRVLVF